MNLYKGRPESGEGRLNKEMRVYDLLDKLQIPYHRIDHPAAMTMEICQALEQTLGASICKNLLLCNRQCTNFYLLMMPSDKPFKTKLLSAQLGTARLSFAQGEYMEQFLDITPGSLSALGLMNDTENRVQLLIDEDLLQEAYIGCHPCINTSTLRIATEDFMKVILPAVHHCPTIVSFPEDAL